MNCGSTQVCSLFWDSSFGVMQFDLDLIWTLFYIRDWVNDESKSNFITPKESSQYIYRRWNLNISLMQILFCLHHLRVLKTVCGLGDMKPSSRCRSRRSLSSKNKLFNFSAFRVWKLWGGMREGGCLRLPTVAYFCLCGGPAKYAGVCLYMTCDKIWNSLKEV